MALIDDLRTLAPHIPPSHKPTVNEYLDILGAWFAYAEHGPGIVKAAAEGADDVLKFLEGETQEPVAPAPASPPPPETPATGGTVTPVADELAQLRAANQQLQAQLQALLASQQHPTVSVAPGPATPPPPAS